MALPPRALSTLVLSTVIALAPVACGGERDGRGGGAPRLDDDLDDLVVPAGCNPLAADWDCLLPFPSDELLLDDPAMPSGRRLSISDAAALHDPSGAPIDLAGIHPPDGFSHASQILALFPEGVDDENLVGADDDLSQSLEPDSPTILIDAASGERILHLAEMDPRAADDSRRALLIRPLVRLKNETRYIVAIRTLENREGSLIEPPEGFRRIRDGEAEQSATLGTLAARYRSDIFPVLETAGVAREELLLAWDFTTGSSELVTRDLMSIRDDIEARFSTSEPKIEVVRVEDDVDEHTFRRIDATVTVPLYVDSALPQARLNADAEGRVVAGGQAKVPFVILVPKSVANRAPGDPPARLLQFGHGFFGSKEEATSFPAAFADERGFVVVATDWWGMSENDRFAVIGALVGEPSEAMRFTDRVHQAMANFMVLAHAARGPLAALPEMQIGPAPLYDAGRVYYYGISQGAVLGGTYLGLAPPVDRGCLGVGGANFSLMMFRARPFAPFLLLISEVVPDPLDQQKFAALMQLPFDRIDPLSYAPNLTASPVLLQVGIGDAEVPNLAAHLHARALDAVHLQPAPRPITGLETSNGPIAGPALVEFDFGIAPLPGIEATPPADPNDVHGDVRRLAASKDQIDAFFQPDGAIEHTCSGACDPE